MKGLILSAFLFLCACTYLILNVQKQQKNIGGQIAQFKAANQGNQQAYNTNAAQPSLTATFAGKPLDDFDNSKYKNFFREAVINEGKIFRWNKSHLTYYIDINTQRRITKSKVRRAFDQWERKSRIFTFSETQNPNNADIAITVATASEKNRMGEAGPDKSYAGQIFNLGGRNIQEYVIHHAQVTIASDYFDIKKVDEYQKAGTDHGFQTLVHELGHVLGLMGHSPTTGDCMFYQAHPSGKACDTLTPEVNTLAMIYGKPNSLTRGFYETKGFQASGR